MMADEIDKLAIIDPRATKQYTEVNGRKWYYILAEPPSTHKTKPPKGTIVLIHGFPDISFTWRYQIPLFLSLGFRCIALDCMGYSSTGTSDRLSDFSFKTHATAIAGICSQLAIPRIVLGGHDWGGATVYRVAQWFPELVSHVFSVCTGFDPPTRVPLDVEEVVRRGLPQFGYQVQFGSEAGVVEGVVGSDEGRMRGFLNGLYGGRVEGGRRFMDPRVGVDLEAVEKNWVGKTPLMSEEDMDFYVAEFMKNGIRGPCNWYRTRKINWEDEQHMPAEVKRTIKQPTLYILATKDDILTREMSKSMEKTVTNLTRGEVEAGHWALWQAPEQVNAILKKWIEGVVLGGKSKL